MERGFNEIGQVGLIIIHLPGHLVVAAEATNVVDLYALAPLFNGVVSRGTTPTCGLAKRSNGLRS